MTNFEKITSSPETLAAILDDSAADCVYCPDKIRKFCDSGKFTAGPCADIITLWLNSPVADITMEILLYDVDNPEREPTAIEVDGESVESLKERLNDLIIKAVTISRSKSRHYSVEIRFTENGEYLDGDELGVCFCDLQEGRVRFEELEGK